MRGLNAGLRVEVGQLQGNCFHFYLRMNGMWAGIRTIHHVHEGACQSDCEANCDGYNEHAVVLIHLIAAWADQARPVILPDDLRRRPLDDIIAEIASGKHAANVQRRRGRKKGSSK